MNSGTGITVSLIYLSFLLVPGYVTLRSFYFTYISTDDLNRLDKLAIIVLGGLISAFIIVGIYRLNLPSLIDLICQFSTSTYSNYASGDIGIHVNTQMFQHYQLNSGVTVSDVSNITILKSGVLIISQSFTGALIGYTYGNYRRKLDDNPQTREELAQPWERAYENTNIGEEVIIVTAQNRTVKGRIQQLGSPATNYDILLHDPVEINRSRNGEITSENDLGRYSYHHYRDISRLEIGINRENKDEELYDPDSSTRGNQTAKEEALTRCRILLSTLRNGVTYLIRSIIEYLKIVIYYITYPARLIVGLCTSSDSDEDTIQIKDRNG